MSEKVKVTVHYELNEEVVKEHILETGEYKHKNDSIVIDFLAFPKDVREIMYEYYGIRQNSISIHISEKERMEYALYDNRTFKPYVFESADEKTIIEEVSLFLRTRATYKEKPMLKTVKVGDYIRIEYDTTIAFRQQELLHNKKILGYKIEALINTMDIEEDVLSFVEELGYIDYNKKIEKMEIFIQPSAFWEEGKYPLSSYLTKDNVNDFLRWYYGKLQEVREKKEEEKKKENNSEHVVKNEKEKWIEEHGSSYLQRATKLQYNCQRLYVEERVQQEFSNWTLDFDNKLSVRERSLPSEAALDIEERMREQHPNIDIRIYWRKEGTSGKEIIVIRNYLGKYTLFQEV